MELQVCAILSHKHRCFVPFAPPPLLSSEPTFSVLKNFKVLKTYIFNYKKEVIIPMGMQTQEHQNGNQSINRNFYIDPNNITDN